MYKNVFLWQVVVFIFVFIIPLVAFANPNNPNDFVNKGKEHNPYMIQCLVEVVAGAPSLNTTRKNIYKIQQYLREEIKNLKAGRSVAAPTLYPSYNVGDVGLLKKVKVLQVIDKENVLVYYDWTQLNNYTTTVLFWVKTDTTDLSDDEEFMVTTLVKITGTITYKTIIGSQTVYQLETLKDVNKITINYKMPDGKIKPYKVVTIRGTMDKVAEIIKENK